MTVRERNISIAQLTGVIVFFGLLATPILYVSGIKTDIAVVEEKILTDRKDISDLKQDIKVTRSLVERLSVKQGIDINKVIELSKSE